MIRAEPGSFPVGFTGHTQKNDNFEKTENFFSTVPEKCVCRWLFADVNRKQLEE